MITRRFFKAFKSYEKFPLQNVIKNNVSVGYCNKIRLHTEITVDTYNDKLKQYIDKKTKFDICTFIREMAPLTPNTHTFELLIKAFGEPSRVMEKLAQELKSDQDMATIKIATEAALQCGGSSQILELFAQMKQRGVKLKQNDFRPLLVRKCHVHKVYNKVYKDTGIMNTLSAMVALDVVPDYETLVEYVLPNVGIGLPNVLMKNFLDAGLTVPTVLTPMVVHLLNQGQMTRAAADLCYAFEGSVDGTRILNPLLRAYLVGGDLDSTVRLLNVVTTRSPNQDKDWVGRFLCLFVYLQNFTTFIGEFRSLIQELSNRDFRLSSEAAVYCLSKMPTRYKERTGGLLEPLMKIMATKYSDNIYLFVQNMPYADQLDKISLGDRLNELNESSTTTKTALNMLLKQAIKEGRLKDVDEIVAKCRSCKVDITPTVEADMFYMYVKLDELKKASQIEAKLRKTAPKFKLNQYMVLEYATRLVYRNNISTAINYLERHSKDKCFTRNSVIAGSCGKLLDAVAKAGTPEQVRRVFDLLTTSYRTPVTNHMLGSLITVHLNNNDLERAIEQFVEITEKYKQAPQQKALLCAVLASAGDSWSEQACAMVETIANAAGNLNLREKFQSVLIAALAELGQTKRLKQMFEDSEVKFDNKTLMWYCEYFHRDNNMHALETIVECAHNYPLLDAEKIYNMMLQFYRRDNNCDGALAMWRRMRVAGVRPSHQLVTDLCDLCSAHQTVAPTELKLLLLRREPSEHTSDRDYK